ncbi:MULTISPECIES: type II secretion system F family protein [unclassified Streptomyces]|uniref:type II secretion system F family protein n=1 Tax=Streptomyces sp. WAC00303 TaxID=2933779 RepID=UPI000BF10326|nr:MULTISPECIES: type II secretion system F family protein [unclassified Streptomyces]UPT43602.1 type II secretion system F family protein [Streptomyces sp. WAC00303]
MTGAPSAYAAHAVALCAGSAVWLAIVRDTGVRRARVLFVDAPTEPRRTWSRWPCLLKALERVTESAPGRREWWCVPVAVLLAVLGGSVLPLVGGAVAVPLVRRWLRRRAGAREAERAATAVVALCGAVVGELRAGREPGQALLVALREGLAEDCSLVTLASTGRLGEAEAAVLAAARFGGDVPAALRQAAQGPGLGGLSGMAACWRVAVDGGAGLATGLERLEATLREDRRRREELRAQLAGAWSTVVVLALLPVVGLGLGAALGAEPLRVLLHTPGGMACLAVGAFLEAAGLYWACRIVRGGEAA